MNSTNSILKITKYLSKFKRPRDFVNNSLSSKHSKSFYYKTNEEVEDLGYMQRQLTKPKDLSALKLKSGFFDSKYFFQ